MRKNILLSSLIFSMENWYYQHPSNWIAKAIYGKDVAIYLVPYWITEGEVLDTSQGVKFHIEGHIGIEA